MSFGALLSANFNTGVVCPHSAFTGVKNYLVVALDVQIAHSCEEHSVHVYRRDATISKVQADTGDSHGISGM